eukprot:712552-Lingulodinium_polyedra.AAC.1
MGSKGAAKNAEYIKAYLLWSAGRVGRDSVSCSATDGASVRRSAARVVAQVLGARRVAIRCG